MRALQSVPLWSGPWAHSLKTCWRTKSRAQKRTRSLGLFLKDPKGPVCLRHVLFVYLETVMSLSWIFHQEFQGPGRVASLHPGPFYKDRRPEWAKRQSRQTACSQNAFRLDLVGHWFSTTCVRPFLINSSQVSTQEAEKIAIEQRGNWATDVLKPWG